VYSIKRFSDGKTKSVTRKIKIADDLLSFAIDLASGITVETTYQNQTTTMYQLKYQAPGVSADDYTLTVTSNNEAVVDVYLMNKDMTFRKATFGVAETPPASHQPGGSLLTAGNSGLIQIKGKQPGTAALTFTLKHKATGANATVTKTVATIADPVKFVIEPAPTIDAMNAERAAIPFGGMFHTYQNPRFKIRMMSNSEYAGNTQGAATVVFSAATSSTNVARLVINGGTHNNANVTYGASVQLFYDVDYFVTVSAPTAHPWNVPAGSELLVNIKMTKATNQQTPIETECNNLVKYALREYQRPTYKITAEIYNENFTGTHSYNAPEGQDVYVYAAGVYVRPRGSRGVVEATKSFGTFYIRNVVATPIETGDATGGIILPVTIPSMGTLGYEKYTGYTMFIIPGYTVSDPDWNKNGAGVAATTYHNMSATVRDNWGCNHSVNVKFPPKIIYGR
jgi:hypothetical protein